MGRGVMPRLPGWADGGRTWDGQPTGYGELPAAMARCRLPAETSRRAADPVAVSNGAAYFLTRGRSMKPRGGVLKWAALRGALDDLPLDAVKLYLLLLIRAQAIASAHRVCFQTIQRALGQSLSREDCQQALAVLAAHDSATWAHVLPHPSRRQRGQRGRESMGIVFPLNPQCG